MNDKSKAVGLGIILILIFCANGASQQVITRPPASEFNIELINLNVPKYVASVPGSGARSGYIANVDLRRIPGWKLAEEVPAEVSVVETNFWLEDGGVRLEVTAYLGQSPPYSRPADWDKLKKIKVATRLVHDGETITINETERFGIEAFQVRVVRAHPWSIGPPEVINKTQALTVLRTDEERPFYTVTVRNVSQKKVTGIQWYGLENERKTGGSGLRGARLIPAGGVFQLHQHFDLPEEKQVAGSQAELSKREIVIAAILLDDGSFEGEPDAAAAMAAQWIGESMQASRLAQLLQSVSLAADEDQSTRLAKLKRDVTSLGEEVDPVIAERLAALFPGASEETRQRRIKAEMKIGLHSAKSNLLREIERFEYRRERSPVTADLQTWLKETAKKYEKAPPPY